MLRQNICIKSICIKSIITYVLPLQLIPPRGCAYVCMNSRQDAYRILTNSSKGLKLHGSTIKVCSE